MSKKLMIVTSMAIAAFALPSGDRAEGQNYPMIAIAWSPVDQTAERIFRQADVDKSGFLTPDQFKAVELKLNSSIVDLERRGALQGLPPNALNARSHGLMLPGATQISRPEFVLEARSRASRLIARRNPFAAVHGPGMNSGRPHPKARSQGKHHGGPQPSITR